MHEIKLPPSPLSPIGNRHYKSGEVICAISTSRGNAALAIIRVSGGDTFSIVQKVVKTKKDFSRLKYNMMYKATFHDDGNIIDDGMLCLFQSPHSYTGEDMAELYCHGNDFIVSQVLEALLKHCRIADNGEFTFRAFLNRKIDLTQAEAIGNLLNAQTKNSQKAALKQLEGKLYNKIKSLLDKLTELRIIYELAIDFIEDEVPEYDSEKILTKMNHILNELNQLIINAPDGIITQEGIKVCLVGAPNVGKSSIFNAFLQTERAIITPIPGTTRDYLEERFTLNGYLIRLFDTAGIHESKDIVEKIGIERTFDIIHQSDLIFHISTTPNPSNLDGNYDTTPSRKACLATTKGNYDKTINVINKSDLLSDAEKHKYLSKGYTLCTTLQDNGLDELKSSLISHFKNIDTEIESGIITNSRQLACVKACHASLTKAIDSLSNGMGIDFIAFDIQQASNHLEEIIGRVSNDDILTTIFQSFCIGK